MRNSTLSILLGAFGFAWMAGCQGNVTSGTGGGGGGVGPCTIVHTYDGESCSTTSDCGSATEEADCAQNGAQVDCSCKLDGVEVGTCTDADLSCSLVTGCCAHVF